MVQFFHQCSVTRKKRIDWLYLSIINNINASKVVSFKAIENTAVINLGLTKYKVREYLKVLADSDKIKIDDDGLITIPVEVKDVQ